MKIREADLEKDALAIIDGAHAFSESAGLMAFFPDDEDEFISAIGRVMVLDGLEILVAEHEDRIVGGIGILYAPYLWNPAITVGDELFWWANDDAPMKTGTLLINKAMENIEEKGALPMFSKLYTSPEGVERLYHRKGLKCIETKFTRF